MIQGRAPTAGWHSVPEAVAGELTPYYYRDNFQVLCDTVEAQYADILQAPERELLRAFRRQEFRTQCLYVRLVSRVAPWFRESRLAYPELGELAELIDALLAAELAVTAAELSVDELGRLYTKAELKHAFAAQLPERPPADKPGLLAAIEELALDPAEMLQLVSVQDQGRVIAPLAHEQVELLQLLFFGNRGQSLTDFVLSDLGVARYYPYQLDRSTRLFVDRPALDEYLACAALSDAWYSFRELGGPADLLELAAIVLDNAVTYPSSERRWHRLCNGLARDLERQGELELAAALYTRSARHPARERRARILERSEQHAGCVDLCRDILAAPWCEQEAEAALRILPRAQRKLDGTRTPRAREKFPGTQLQLPRGEGAVELLVAEHLAPRWRAVHYVENRLMNTLFGLAFWEEIFAPVPGAFHNPYQGVPADMYESVFREPRAGALAARLAGLREGDLAVMLGDAYRRYFGYQCHWVDWRLDEELLAQALAIIPAAHLLAIWERILFDPGENRAGFPDLIALGEGPGRYCMIEVKAPGDALQDSQRRWLRFFQAQQIPAEVAWVEWR